jgi:hypothetical protein
MDAMSTSNKTLNAFITSLSLDYPDFRFRIGKQERWSPKTNTIIFNPDSPSYGLLHELAHAVLGHSTYGSDFELLKMEAEAWELAIKLGKTYGIKISDDHIQNCLDTYRDWLHKRSACPTCGTHVLQQSQTSYLCFNCQATWSVSSERFVRPYRKTMKIKNPE